jgi:hypothetical protein
MASRYADVEKLERLIDRLSYRRKSVVFFYRGAAGRHARARRNSYRPDHDESAIRCFLV